MNIIEPKLLEAVFEEEWAMYRQRSDPKYSNVPFKIDSIKQHESGYHKNFVQNTMIMIKGTARDNRSWDMDINLYQLMHVCKAWAHNNNFWLSSCFTGEVKMYNVGETYPFKTLHTEITEPEGVFAACTWILEQKNKEDKNNE